MKDDSQSRYMRVFTTITPQCWQDCVPLQPADLIAYELFKELDRRLFASNRNMRRFLKRLIGKTKTVGISSCYFNRRALLRLREEMERSR